MYKWEKKEKVITYAYESILETRQRRKGIACPSAGTPAVLCCGNFFVDGDAGRRHAGHRWRLISPARSMRKTRVWVCERHVGVTAWSWQPCRARRRMGKSESDTRARAYCPFRHTSVCTHGASWIDKWDTVCLRMVVMPLFVCAVFNNILWIAIALFVCESGIRVVRAVIVPLVFDNIFCLICIQCM